MTSRTRLRTVAVAIGLMLAIGLSSACSAPQSTRSKGSQAAGYAEGQVGSSYVYGGSSPNTGFDCSGLTSWSWAAAGVSLPRTATDQYWATTRVTRSELQPGDLIFYGTSTSNIVHVTIYVGNGLMVSASNPNSGVEEANVDQWWTSMRFAFGRVNG